MATIDTTTATPATYGPPDSDARPEPASWNPWLRVWDDLISERRARVPFPPGPNRFDFPLTKRMAHDPLPVLVNSVLRHFSGENAPHRLFGRAVGDRHRGGVALALGGNRRAEMRPDRLTCNVGEAVGKRDLGRQIHAGRITGARRSARAARRHGP